MAVLRPLRLGELRLADGHPFCATSGLVRLDGAHKFEGLAPTVEGDALWLVDAADRRGQAAGLFRLALPP